MKTLRVHTRRNITAPICNFTMITLLGAISLHSHGDSSLLLEEVIVTAQKHRQNVQDVAISISAFNGDQIKELGYSNATQVTAQAPAVSYSSVHPSNAAFSIRAVSQNDFADHLEPPIALYTDEAYIPHQAAATVAMFDVDRVEILRGPQGTLFGRNATGGLVHIVSAAPTDEYTGYIDVTIGEDKLRKVEAAVSGGLSESLRGRLAITQTQSDGWFDNRFENNQMNQDSYAARLSLEYDISPTTRAF